MQRGPSRQQKRQLLVFSELPSLPSAGSRSGCFHNSLGCEPRSLIRVSLGLFDYSKKCEEGRSNAGLFASRCPQMKWGRALKKSRSQVKTSQVKVLICKCQTSGMFTTRPAQAQEIQHRGLFVFSKLPSLPSTVNRTSLGCKRRSLIWGSLGLFDYSSSQITNHQ
jgi:hypothetical protein